MEKELTESLKDRKVKKFGEWTELNRKQVYENPWIKVTESDILNPRGGKGIYGVVHFKNLAIGIIPLDDEYNTWIVGQERFPFEGKYSWEIIEGGGPLERDPLISAKMELSEEAGLAAESWEIIQEMDLSNSVSDEKAIIYVAKGLSLYKTEEDESEVLEIRKVPFKTLYEMVIKGEVRDSLSVAGVLRLKMLIDEGKF